MTGERFPVGSTMLFCPGYEAGLVEYEVRITGWHIAEVYRVRAVVTKIIYRNPMGHARARHGLRTDVAGLDSEFFPLLRTPKEIEDYLAT